MCGLEYHFNGAGQHATENYLSEYSSAEIGRGETYLVGQHYLGTLLSYQAGALVTLTFSVLSNLLDPSAVIAPNIRYHMAENVDLSLGAYYAIGAEPEFGLSPRLSSEFGSFGELYFLSLNGYF